MTPAGDERTAGVPEESNPAVGGAATSPNAASKGYHKNPAGEIVVTTFPDVRARTTTCASVTFAGLAAMIESPKVYRDKAACPLIMLAELGDRATENGSLRHAGNILAVHGIEGDYDAGAVSIDAAAEKLCMAGVRAVLYTTPSHRAEAPRWRVLAPLSGAYLPRERERFVARLNGVLGAILAPESYTLVSYH